MSGQESHDLSTRDRLIAATLDIIDHQGASAVKVGEVVKRAGTTTGSLYWFFRDRQHLINASLADRYVRKMSRMLDTIREITGSNDVPIDALLNQSLDLSEQPRADARRQRIRILADALDDADLTSEIANIQKQFIGVAVEMLERAQAAGRMRQDIDAFALALYAQATTVGLAIADLSPDLMPDPEKWWHLNSVFLDALRPR